MPGAIETRTRANHVREVGVGSLPRIAPAARRVIKVPSGRVEFGFYFVVFYSIFGQVVLPVPMLGVGALFVLAAICVAGVPRHVLTLLKLLAGPLLFGVTFLAVQVLVHGVPVLHADIRAVVTWVLGLIVVQCLSFRPGFLRRFGLAAIGVGVCLLPFLSVRINPSDLERTGVEGAGLANPNSLGMWFGFCAVYAVISGVQAKSNAQRILWLVGAAGCMYVIGLTVSRGPLLGVAVAAAIAFQPLLRRGFVPLLVVVIVGCSIAALGVFDHVVTSYAARGMEETGRGVVWPLAFARFLESPLSGVSVENVYTTVRFGQGMLPHNGVIYVALVSGIVPALLFVAFWARAVLVAVSTHIWSGGRSPFLLPLMVFALLEIMILDTAFMSPWHLVVLCHAFAANAYYRTLNRPRAHRVLRSNASPSPMQPVLAYPAYRRSS